MVMFPAHRVSCVTGYNACRRVSLDDTMAENENRRPTPRTSLGVYGAGRFRVTRDCFGCGVRRMGSLEMSKWYVYMVEGSDHSIYTGASTDPVRRIHEHNCCDKKGSKWARGRRPVILLAVFPIGGAAKSDALKLEAKIKKMNREQKLLFLKKLGERNEPVA